MSDPAPGRPSAGATLAADIRTARAARPKAKDIRPLRRLAPYLARHRGHAIAAGVFLVTSTAATLGLTGAARFVIDRGFSTGAFLAAVAVAVGLAVATALRFYFVTRLGERVTADLRRDLYRHVLTLDAGFFLKTRTGEVLSRLTTDIALVESVSGATASLALRNLLTLIGSLALLFLVSHRLMLAVLAIVPFVILPLFVVGRQVRTLSVKAQDRFADAVAYAGETLDQLETVQAFGREPAAAARFGGAVEQAFDASQSRARARAIMTALVMALVFGGVAGVLWLGARAVAHHEMTSGTLLQFLFLSVLAAGAVGTLGESWGEVQKAAGAMQRIDEILTAQPSIRAPAQPKALPQPARGEIAFEDVTFAYPGRPDLPALNGFSLAVRPGETVALVGPSGAGKSTVLRLLLRFYDPQAGAVRLDGIDLRDADPAEVRARLSLVAQDASLFSGSALENIRFGREAASEEEALQAAEAAEAGGFLSLLPQKLNEPLGERGRTLSGGQRQRLAIARALVREAPVLLLDEATSALDAENERLVQAALHKAMTDRTTLVIAHRLATVLRADRIVVMEDGRVVEEGRHGELVARGGLYARLAELQFGAQAA